MAELGMCLKIANSAKPAEDIQGIHKSTSTVCCSSVHTAL